MHVRGAQVEVQIRANPDPNWGHTCMSCATKRNLDACSTDCKKLKGLVSAGKQHCTAWWAGGALQVHWMLTARQKRSPSAYAEVA